MWPIFKLLFSKKYWRLLLRAHTWRSTWVAAKRVHKDRRSWKQLARIAYLLLVPLSFPVFVIGIATGIAGGWVLVWLFIGLMVVLSRVGFGRKPESSGVSIEEIEAELHKTEDLWAYMARLAMLHAILINRAASENFLRTKTLPDGIEVVTRQKHMQLLRELEIYDRLGSVERTLLLMPDGHWPEHKANAMFLALEPLRLLRWVLRMDAYLPTVGETIVADLSLASLTIAKPASLKGKAAWVHMRDIDTAINAADVFFYRCWAELVYRGVHREENAERETELRNYALSLGGSESKDLLLGEAIVSKAEERDVRQTARNSLRRAHILRVLRSLLLGDPVPSELSMFYPADLDSEEEN